MSEPDPSACYDWNSQTAPSAPAVIHQPGVSAPNDHIYHNRINCFNNRIVALTQLVAALNSLLINPGRLCVLDHPVRKPICDPDLEMYLIRNVKFRIYIAFASLVP